MATFTTLMKKLLLTILAFVYLAVASGMSVNMHYCMEKLVSWNLTGNHDKDCPVCNTEEKGSGKTTLSCKGCCKDELKQLQLEKDYKAEQHISSNVSFGEPHFTNSFNELTLFVPVKLTGANNINAPPVKYKVPSFIFNCVFRI